MVSIWKQKMVLKKMVILCVYLAGLIWVWLKSIQIFEKPFDRLMDDADEAFQNKL